MIHTARPPPLTTPTTCMHKLLTQPFYRLGPNKPNDLPVHPTQLDAVHHAPVFVTSCRFSRPCHTSQHHEHLAMLASSRGRPASRLLRAQPKLHRPTSPYYHLNYMHIVKLNMRIHESRLNLTFPPVILILQFSMRITHLHLHHVAISPCRGQRHHSAGHPHCTILLWSTPSQRPSQHRLPHAAATS